MLNWKPQIITKYLSLFIHKQHYFVCDILTLKVRLIDGTDFTVCKYKKRREGNVAL